MTDDRARFARTFASIRGGAQSAARQESDAGLPQPKEDPEGQQEEQKQPQEQPTVREPGTWDSQSLFFHPQREQSTHTNPASDPWAGERLVEVDAPLAEGVGMGPREPSDLAGEILRATTPVPRRDTQGVMTMIRQDIAYRQGKVLEDEVAKVEGPVPRPAGVPGTTASQTVSRRNLAIGLPGLPAISMGWARNLVAIGVAVIALVYALAELGFGGHHHYVHFTVQAPNARTVSVVGDFNGWDAGRHEMKRLPGNTVWEAWVRVEPGRYRYGFLIDGQLHALDSSRQSSIDDELQRGVSILIVPSQGGMPEVHGDAEAAAVARPIPAPVR